MYNNPEVESTDLQFYMNVLLPSFVVLLNYNTQEATFWNSNKYPIPSLTISAWYLVTKITQIPNFVTIAFIYFNLFENEVNILPVKVEIVP